MNLINTSLLLLTFLTFAFADHVTNVDNEKIILTCEDGPCNRPNLNGFECSYTKVNDNYKFVCLSEEVSIWNSLDLSSLDNVKDNFNKFFIGYFVSLTIFFIALIQLKICYKFISYLINI